MPTAAHLEFRRPRLRPARLTAGVAINLAGIFALSGALLNLGAG